MQRAISDIRQGNQRDQLYNDQKQEKIKQEAIRNQERMTLSEIGAVAASGDYTAAARKAFESGKLGIGNQFQGHADQRQARASVANEKRMAELKKKLGNRAIIAMREANPKRQAAMWESIKREHGGQLGPEYGDAATGLALVAAESGMLQQLLQFEQGDRRIDLQRERLNLERQTRLQPKTRDPLDVAYKTARIDDIRFKQEQARKKVEAAEAEARAEQERAQSQTNNLRQGIENLNSATEMPGFNNAVGQFQGGETSVLGAPVRAVNDLLSPGGQREIRAKIEGDTRALSTAIKPLIRKPGEGTFTDADQRQLDQVLGDLAGAQDEAEYRRRLSAVRDRIEANFGLKLGRLSFEGSDKDQDRVPSGGIPSGWSVTEK